MPLPFIAVLSTLSEVAAAGAAVGAVTVVAFNAKEKASGKNADD